MGHSIKYSPKLVIGIVCFYFFMVVSPVFAAEDTTGKTDQLLPLLGDALMEAREEDWLNTLSKVNQYHDLWQEIEHQEAATTEEINAVDEALQEILIELKKKEPNGEAAYKSLTALVKATNNYLSAPKAAGSTQSSKEEITTLLPILNEITTEINNNNLERAKNQYDTLVAKWTEIEAPIREKSLAVYGTIETKMSLIRVALNATPLDVAKVQQTTHDLQLAIEDFSNGKSAMNEDTTTVSENMGVSDLLALLNEAEMNIEEGAIDKAAEHVQQFIQLWPAVEGEVRTRSTEVYQNTENNMAEALTILVSQSADKSEASTILQTMKSELEPFTDAANYTVWDAFLILFREGLEALLIVAALLAFLNRTGNRSKQGWIWSGVASGFVVSVGLSIVLTMMLSKVAAGSSRELIEGLVGLIAVVFMFTVGAWLHSKSSVGAWNKYISDQMNVALERRTPLLLAIISFFAVVREGAETIIFYVGMAPSIAASKLMMGIGLALFVLIILGFVMIKYSVKIPVRPFFLVASFLIYYIAFKFLGVSIHALQVANKFPAHVSDSLITFNWLGIYPTWETTIPQLVLLLFIIVNSFLNERKRRDGSFASIEAHNVK